MSEFYVFVLYSLFCSVILAQDLAIGITVLDVVTARQEETTPHEVETPPNVETTSRDVDGTTPQDVDATNADDGGVFINIGDVGVTVEAGTAATADFINIGGVGVTVEAGTDATADFINIGGVGVTVEAGTDATADFINIGGVGVTVEAGTDATADFINIGGVGVTVLDDSTTATDDVTVVSSESSRAQTTAMDVTTTSLSISLSTDGDDSMTSAAPDPGLSPRPTLVDIECDRETQAGCDITNLERCTLIRERSPRCRCIAGYARGKDGVTCVAVKTYMLSLTTNEPFTTFLYDPLSEKYRQLEYQARNALLDIIDDSLLSSVAMDVIVTGFRQSSSNTIVIDFKLELARDFLASEDVIRATVAQSVRESLVPDPRGRGLVLPGTNILIVADDIEENLFVMEPDPCLDALLNYCSRDAVCVMLGGAFSCQCPVGYRDESLNSDVISGEICTRDLSGCDCQNDGRCRVDDDTGAVECSCPTLYFGAKCEVDGRIVLIVAGIVLLTMIFISVAVCGRRCVRRRSQSAAFAEKCGNLSRSGFRPYFGHAWFSQRRFYGKPTSPTAYLIPQQQAVVHSAPISMTPYGWQAPVRSVFTAPGAAGGAADRLDHAWNWHAY